MNGNKDKWLAVTGEQLEHMVAALPSSERAAVGPAPGMVRVYHGGASSYEPGSGDLWFSTDRAYAEGYAQQNGGGSVSYVDLPAGDPRINNPDYADQGVAQGFTFNFTLPEADYQGMRTIGDLASSEAGATKAVTLGELLGGTAGVDPALAVRQRQEMALQAASPLRPGAVDAEGTGGLGLFDAADTFRLDFEGGEIKPADLLAELDADDKAIAALKACL